MARLTPLRAIRKHCLWCCNGSSHEVKLCEANSCPSWRLRFGKGVRGISTLKTIRRKCIDCSAFTPLEVRKCKFTDCPLFAYRFGHNPALKGKRGKGTKTPAFLTPTRKSRAVLATSKKNTPLDMPPYKAGMAHIPQVQVLTTLGAEGG